MPEPTIRIALPYEPDDDLTATTYGTLDDVFGPGAEVVLDVERDQGIGEILPYVGIVLTYVGTKGLDLLTEESWKKLGDWLRALARGGGDRGGPDQREVRLVDRDRRAVFVFDRRALDSARALRAIRDVAVPDSGAEVVFRWDDDGRSWRVDRS
jgi:hypothetical protein